MQTKSWLIIAGVIIVLAFGYLAYSSMGRDVAPAVEENSDTLTDEANESVGAETGESTPAASETSPVTITYDGSRFSPANVTVPVGTTVTWTNQSGGRMWVGSDDHPTHTRYDGTSTGEHCANGAPTGPEVFDQCSATASFSFTFTKPGTWAYHNHANSSARGSVTVTP